MPKKSAKGSAKKKGSAKAKSAKGREEPPPPPSGPSWPWEKHFVAWAGRDPDHRRRIVTVFREHYVRGEGIICSHADWDATVRCYTGPLANPNAEAMVQMLAVALARPASRTHPADNLAQFSAAIRFRHSHTHFERMYQLMVPFFRQADGSPSVQGLLDVFKPSELQADTTQYINRVKDALAGLNVTMGVVAPPAEGAEPKVVWKQAALEKGLMFVFMEFLFDQKERLVDLFFRMDKDRSGTITREEFKAGMQALGIPGTEQQLVDLIDELDTDGDGEMNYKEMAEGRIKSVEAMRVASKVEVSAATMAPAAELLVPSHLSFGFDDFVSMVIHCHYTTRP